MFLVYLILGIPLMYYVMKLCVWLSKRLRAGFIIGKVTLPIELT